MRGQTPGSPAFPLWKLAPPQISDYAFLRTRLIAALESSLTDPFGRIDTVLVNAPPGYGKSTLLAQWATSTTLPVVWYHLDASDSDPATLLYGLIHVFRTLARRGHWETRELLGHTSRGALAPDDIRRAAEVFGRDIAAHIVKPAVLVLTGVDRLEPRGEARTLLEHVLARTKDELRIVLEYRELELLKFSVPLVQGRIKSIGLDDLQCTNDELAELLASRGIVADATYLADLQALCDGWVAGAVLATGISLPKALAARVTDEFNREAVFDYAAREVLAQFPQPLYNFAVDASILDDMTAPLCRDVLGIEEARELLGTLTRMTGMVSRVGERPEESVYRFQPLLRSVLQERLIAARGAEGVASLRLRAAEYLERVDDEHSDDQAIQHYALAGAADALIALIERRRVALLRAGRGATLAHWIDLIEPDQRKRHPDLMVLQAELHRVAGRTGQAEATIDAVFAQLLASCAPCPVTHARALLVRADIRYLHGRYADGRHDCEQALDLLPADEAELHMQAHFLRVACTNMLDGPAAAKRRLDEIEAACRAWGDHSMLARFYYLRATLSHAEGAFLEAESGLGTALLLGEEASDKVRAAVARLYRGSIRQHLGQASAAREDLEAALAQSEEIGHSQVRAYTHVALADLEILVGRFDAARAHLDAARALDGHLDEQHLRALLAVSSSRLNALSGHEEIALTIVESALTETENARGGQDWTLLQTALGFACYRAGQYERALQALQAMIPVAREHHALAECAQAYLIVAATRVAQGEPARAAVVFASAFDLAQEIDGTAASLLDARWLPTLLPLAETMAHPLAADLLHRLTQSHRIALGQGTDDSAASDLPIRVFTLGKVAVLVGEKAVARWQRPLARDLLLYLLGKETPARKSEMLLALWPEKSEKAADEEFRKVRSALKQALGYPCLVERSGLWSLNLACWVDAEEFVHLTDEGIALAKQGDEHAAGRVFRQALSLWGGSYLDDHWSDWAVARREVLQVRYLDLLDRLADIELHQQWWSEVEMLSHRLLKESEFHERAHRRLMLCYAARGDFPQAHKQFLRCRTLLQRDLHIEPSAETIALSEKIRARARHGTAEPIEALLRP